MPYAHGVCESIKKSCGKYSNQTYFKGADTLKNILVMLKDQDQIQQNGVIYWYKCDRLQCDE